KLRRDPRGPFLEDSNPLEHRIRHRTRRSRILARDEVAVDNDMRGPGSQRIIEHRTSILEGCFEVPRHPKLTQTGLIFLLVCETRHPVAVEEPQAISSLRRREQCCRSVPECSGDA